MPGHESGDGNRPPDAPAVVECEIRRRVPADAHERPLAERDLARVPGDDVQPEQHYEVQADQRHVSLLERAEKRRQHGDDRDADGEAHTACDVGAENGPHTRLVTVLPKRPSGFTTSTSRSTPSAIGSLNSCDSLTKSTYVCMRAMPTPRMYAPSTAPSRAVQAAEHGRGERVDDDREHVVRVERRRGDHRHQPGDGAESGGQPPAEGEHHDDADAEQPARVGPYGGSSHHQAGTGEAEDEIDDGDADERHAEDVDRLLRDGDVTDRHGLERERAENVLRLRRPDPGSRAVQDDEQRDRADDDRDLAGLRQRPDDPAVDERATDERDGERDPEADPERQLPALRVGDEPPGDVRREHRHLALGEVDDTGRAVDEHEGEREHGIDPAVGEAGDDGLDEVRPVHQPRYDLLTRSSSRSSSLAPSITTRPTSSTYARCVEASAMPAFCSTTSMVRPISCVSEATSS